MSAMSLYSLALVGGRETIKEYHSLVFQLAVSNLQRDRAYVALCEILNYSRDNSVQWVEQRALKVLDAMIEDANTNGNWNGDGRPVPLTSSPASPTERVRTARARAKTRAGAKSAKLRKGR